MQKPVIKRWRTFIRRHLLSFIALPVAVCACAGFIYFYILPASAKIETIQQDSLAKLKADDITIAAIKAQKAALLKAAQEAEAKTAAEQARTATDASAATVNSASCNTSQTHNNPSSIDVVVNKKHCMQPVTYVPTDLVDVGGGFLLSAKAADAFHALSSAASAANEPFVLTSSYRSYSDQVSTYAYWVNTSGKDGADTYSARPGYSEHQTGLAFDVSDPAKHYVLSDFGQTSQYQWLQAHAADYGFIQRYYAGSEAVTGYKAEEWHYRFVGVTVAKDMQTKGIKTLEAYWGISGGDYF